METISLGAGMHAAAAIGWFDSISEAADAMSGEGVSYAPDEPDSTVALHVLAPPRYFAVMPVACVALGLDGGDVVPLYLGDDITDDAFRAGSGSGRGVFAGQPDDGR